MASESDAVKRKHRLSSSPEDDEEAERSSKRHKHRHHRHHRRRHNRHRSKKEGGEERKRAAGSDDDDDDGGVDKEEDIVLADNGAHGGEDVEEGEILEEGEMVDGKTADDDDRNQNEILAAYADESRNGFASDSQPGERFDGNVYGDLGSEGRKEEKRQHRESGSGSKTSSQRKNYYDVEVTRNDENKSSDFRKSSSSESGGDKYKTPAHSPSHDRNHYEAHRSRSTSRDTRRERSHSCSLIEDEALLKRRQHRERADNDSDDERISARGRDQWREEEKSRDREREWGRGKEPERSRDRDTERDWGRYKALERSRDSDLDRERRREWERERSRDREVDRGDGRERELGRSRDREIVRDDKRERESRRSRERLLDRDDGRERELRRSRDRELDRDDGRAREWRRSRDRELDRDHRGERERSRDRELDRDYRGERERIRDREHRRDQRRERLRERSRDREEELDRKRQKEGEKCKDIDMARTNERERVRDRERGKDRDQYRIRDNHDTDGERRTYKSRDSSRATKMESIKEHISNNDSLEGARHKLKRDEDDEDDFEQRISLKLAEREEEDLERIKEESRKRRQAILEKYKNQQLQQQNESQPGNSGEGAEQIGHPAQSANVASQASGSGTEGGDADVAEPSFSLGKSPTQNGVQASETSGTMGLGEGIPKSERSEETYCDDIFGETPAGIRKSGKGDGQPVLRSGLRDNWDDPDGYYSYRFGEILDGRYEIASTHGKGVFSTVVRAKDLKASNGEPEEVAIKIIRNNETMDKAGRTEVQILQKLAGVDPEDKRHCVRFLSSFTYRNHRCLVFESLQMNLREVLKKFGRNIGLKLTAVRAYATQLFIALKHLKNCGVLHCDIKPDNMLVNETKNVLKLCDFGNAMWTGDNEITPYLVSRFYRAPEIILGLPYDHPMDMWSVGCCLYELYTGKVLFPGPTNNDMLRLHMELKGPFSKKMLKKGMFVNQHFDSDLNFHSMEEDPVTKKAIKRMILNIKPKDVNIVLKSSPGDDPKMFANFKDLLDKIFILDPEKRLTVSQALAHPFITGK